MIRVSVFRRSGRPFYEAQWTNPVTGKKETKSTKKRDHKEALKEAGNLQNKLNSGAFAKVKKVTWKEARTKYTKNVLAALSDKTKQGVKTSLDSFEGKISPCAPSVVTEEIISDWQESLRESGLAEMTIKCHVLRLLAFLKWCKKQKYITTIPEIEVPKKVVTMKGRSITDAEFQKLLDHVAEVVGDDADSWKKLLQGLWDSGLRLSEALLLHWQEGETGITVSFEYAQPMFLIRADIDKSRKDRVLPIAPEFAQILLQTPKSERVGYVFKFRPKLFPEQRYRMDWVSKVIVRIGEAAKIKVSSKGHANRKEGKENAKFASAHDLRRAFGYRWAKRVLPPVLQELMRHESIQTTMQFYVGRHAEVAAKTAWEAFANIPANTSEKTTSS